LEEAYKKAKAKGWLEVGDYVIIISGEFESFTGHLNCMQVSQVV
jgi:transcription antitermination factor NusG